MITTNVMVIAQVCHRMRSEIFSRIFSTRTVILGNHLLKDLARPLFFPGEVGKNVRRLTITNYGDGFWHGPDVWKPNTPGGHFDITNLSKFESLRDLTVSHVPCPFKLCCKGGIIDDNSPKQFWSMYSIRLSSLSGNRIFSSMSFDLPAVFYNQFEVVVRAFEMIY